MAHGARLGTVVMFVPDLDRSVSFYLEVLGLEVADRSPTAALLISAEGKRTSTGPRARCVGVRRTGRPAAAEGSWPWRAAIRTTSS
jgi:catechol 2,3-dioxygenase-like lactoylglutathione lyase family enzyme